MQAGNQYWSPFQDAVNIWTNPPSEIRTNRYVGIEVVLHEAHFHKRLFVAWTSGNGIPDDCLLLVPQDCPNVTISFHSTRGWLEVEDKQYIEGKPTVKFEIRFDLVDSAKNTVHTSSLVSFVLWHKVHNSLTKLGTVTFNVAFKCAKNSNTSLRGDLQYENTGSTPKMNAGSVNGGNPYVQYGHTRTNTV